jgi:hypothetical protein
MPTVNADTQCRCLKPIEAKEKGSLKAAFNIVG